MAFPLVIRPPSETVTANEGYQPRGSRPTYVPANGLTLGAASTVVTPGVNPPIAASAPSAVHPASVHRLIDRFIVHLVFVGPAPRPPDLPAASRGSKPPPLRGEPSRCPSRIRPRIGRGAAHPE